MCSSGPSVSIAAKVTAPAGAAAAQSTLAVRLSASQNARLHPWFLRSRFPPPRSLLSRQRSHSGGAGAKRRFMEDRSPVPAPQGVGADMGRLLAVALLAL